jgi:hypothetical protein
VLNFSQLPLLFANDPGVRNGISFVNQSFRPNLSSLFLLGYSASSLITRHPLQSDVTQFGRFQGIPPPSLRRARMYSAHSQQSHYCTWLCKYVLVVCDSCLSLTAVPPSFLFNKIHTCNRQDPSVSLSLRPTLLTKTTFKKKGKYKKKMFLS